MNSSTATNERERGHSSRHAFLERHLSHASTADSSVSLLNPVSNCEESAMLLPTSGWNTCGLLFACYLPTESPHGVSRNWGGTLITDRWSTILSPLPAPTVVSERKPQHTSNGFTLRPTMHRRRFHRSESSPLEKIRELG